MADDGEREVIVTKGSAVGKTTGLVDGKPVRSGQVGNPILRAALLAHLPVLAKPAPSLLDELRTRGAPLSGLKVVGVPSGHEHYPEPKQFKLEGRTLYVRAEDFPKLQAALAKQRALRTGPSSPLPREKGVERAPDGDTPREVGQPASQGQRSPEPRFGCHCLLNDRSTICSGWDGEDPCEKCGHTADCHQTELPG